MKSVLANAYRPRAFDEVVGNPRVVKSFARHIERRSHHAFVLIGPSGVGKTTLARIAARKLGCHYADIFEIDAASRNGIDEMRDLTRSLAFKPMGRDGARAVILDECQRLSKAAWESLLKPLEEPPEHAFWFLLTTEPSKIPGTIKTRTMQFKLDEIPDDDIAQLVEEVAEAEKMKVRGDIMRLVVAESRGSARQALVNLEIVRECDNVREARAALSSAIEAEPVLELCRMFISSGSWKKAMVQVELIQKRGIRPESARIQISHYFAKVAMGAGPNTLQARLMVLRAFGVPFNESDGMAPLIRAIGTVFYGGDDGSN